VLLEANPQETNIPENAYLIVNGTQIISLTHSVINIGRRSDNQMALDDPRVSRVHAQLRAIKGRFVIFDLDSTGGHLANAQRITGRRCTLEM
jgi:pSer/pThr/pTyr-binding forkhead associated (FHA) protein